MVNVAVCFHNLTRIRYPPAQNAALEREYDDHNIIPGEWRQDTNKMDIHQVVRGYHDTLQARYPEGLLQQ